jgi:hypothetical protein
MQNMMFSRHGGNLVLQTLNPSREVTIASLIVQRELALFR